MSPCDAMTGTKSLVGMTRSKPLEPPAALSFANAASFESYVAMLTCVPVVCSNRAMFFGAQYCGQVQRLTEPPFAYVVLPELAAEVVVELEEELLLLPPPASVAAPAPA